MEQGIPIDPYLLLEANKTSEDLREKSLADFEARINSRYPKVEHSILNRLNCHKEKFDQLYKNFNQQFLDKNRYPDMLPFRFNRVKLNKQYRPFSAIRNISNSFQNVARPVSNNISYSCAADAD